MNRWIHVRFIVLARLLEDQRLPDRLRWHWVVAELRGRKHLQVVSPRGVHWDFKLNGGAYLRRVEPKEPREG